MTDQEFTLESLMLSEESMTEMASLDIVPKPIELRRAELEFLDPQAKRTTGTFYYHDIQGTAVGGAIRFRCNVNIWNRLCFNRVPISARNLGYFFSGIQWTAGRGWPTYSERCPLSDTNPVMLFPKAKRHMLVVQFGGYYWDECSNSNTGIGKEITDIFVGPNDNDFGDNKGGFEFIITSYS